MGACLPSMEVVQPAAQVARSAGARRLGYGYVAYSQPAHLGHDCSRRMTPAELRALVPAVRGRAYLDTATYGPAAEPTAAAVNAFVREWSTGSTRFETWDGYVEECRALFG